MMLRFTSLLYFVTIMGILLFPATLTVSTTRIEPSEAKVEAAVNPNRLIIPAIDVSAPIKAMGINKDGRMAVPNNYTEVGWLKTSAHPGNMGASVMGAHVDNGGKIGGVFKNLKSLKPGHNIYVTDARGHVYTYRITKLKIYNKNLIDTSAIFMANSKRLNLITCHGPWLPAEHTYRDRLVVSAELVTT